MQLSLGVLNIYFLLGCLVIVSNKISFSSSFTCQFKKSTKYPRISFSSYKIPVYTPITTSTIFQSINNEDANYSLLSNESVQKLIGIKGILFSFIMLYSEFILKTTGCGLPSDKFGIVGFLEGISYLAVSALVGFSLYTKVTTGKGLSAGPGNILGIAEGLAYLAVLVGIGVLGFQILDYGYIPNAIPMEGGMCT